MLFNRLHVIQQEGEELTNAQLTYTIHKNIPKADKN
jgi:hypothetical protein